MIQRNDRAWNNTRSGYIRCIPADPGLGLLLHLSNRMISPTIQLPCFMGWMFQCPKKPMTFHTKLYCLRLKRPMLHPHAASMSCQAPIPVLTLRLRALFQAPQAPRMNFCQLESKDTLQSVFRIALSRCPFKTVQSLISIPFHQRTLGFLPPLAPIPRLSLDNRAFSPLIGTPGPIARRLISSLETPLFSGNSYAVRLRPLLFPAHRTVKWVGSCPHVPLNMMSA